MGIGCTVNKAISPRGSEEDGLIPGFMAYSRRLAARLRDEGRYDAAGKLDMYVRRFVAFLGKSELPLNNIDRQLIRNYRAWLEGRGLARNSTSLYVRNLKRVYLQAVSEGLVADSHPFDGQDVSYRVKKERNGLSIDDIVRLRFLDLGQCNKSVCFARDIFLFSVFAHGMAAKDIFSLTHDNIRDGRLTYVSNITGRVVTITLTPLLKEIADNYARPDTSSLFPVVTSDNAKGQWRQHCTALHNINRNLKTIGRMLGLPYPLNMTVARHTGKGVTRGADIGDIV